MTSVRHRSPVRSDRRAQIEAWLAELRARTEQIVGPLDDHSLYRQVDPIMSPLVWDVGHVANFEELWLLRALDGRLPHDPQLDRVYNPFENPRWVRSELELLDRHEALAYMEAVRADALGLLTRADLAGDDPLQREGYVYAMVAQHEAQHHETMLQAVDLAGETFPPYEPARRRRIPRPRPVDDLDRRTVPGGPFRMGTDDRSTAYDNERPSHVLDVPVFAIDRFPVTCRRYAEFVAAGGYERPELWSEPGRAWLAETGHRAPQGWIPSGDGWLVQRFGHVGPLDAAEPVQHLSFWEAEAYCRFAGGRLPTEAEWEKAALWDERLGRARRYPWGDTPPGREQANLDHRGWGPAPVGSYPRGASPYGVEQLVGDVHEWTSDDFGPYPGYETFPYEEYSEVFFGDGSKVLRGSSWASAALVARGTFRNWDFPQRRQIFSGVRVAYPVGA